MTKSRQTHKSASQNYATQPRYNKSLILLCNGSELITIWFMRSFDRFDLCCLSALPHIPPSIAIALDLRFFPVQILYKVCKSSVAHKNAHCIFTFSKLRTVHRRNPLRCFNRAKGNSAISLRRFSNARFTGSVCLSVCRVTASS